MTEPLYTLGFTEGEDDKAYHTLRGLAHELVRRRNLLPGRPTFKLRCAEVWRGLEGGACVSVRVADGAHQGRGSLVGYAFFPGAEQPLQRLALALMDVDDKAEAAA